MPVTQTFRPLAAMYQASADDCGTVQVLSRELDEAQEDGMFLVSYPGSL